MAKFNVTKYGLVGDGITPNDEALQKLINEVPENSTLFFPKGTYFIPKKVEIKGKHKLTLKGEDAVLMTHCAPCGDPKENNNLFDAIDSTDFAMIDFVITTDNIVGWAGVLTAVNLDELYYEVKIDEQFHVTGLEHPVELNSCDADGTPDYLYNGGVWRNQEDIEIDGKKVTRYGSHSYEVVGDHLVRFKFPEEHKAALAKMPIGEKMCYRFTNYGNCCLGLRNTQRVLIKNVHIYRYPSMSMVIGRRSADVTLDHFTVKVKPGSRELYAGNCDGIHINGLTGYLRMKHCEFNGLGDDSLNVHSMPGEVMEIKPDGSFVMKQPIYGGGHNEIDDYWVKSGETLEVYDRKTFLRKGTLTVADFKDGIVTLSKAEGEYEVGDILGNSVFFPTVHISDCIVKNTRARALLIRTRDVLVEDCYFYGLSLPGIIVTPDINRWYEFGPSERVTIRNNVFEKCAIIKAPQNLGAIAVKTADDVGVQDYPAGVHKDIKILNNRFINIGNSAIHIACVDGVEIKGNRFENCCSHRYNTRAYNSRFDIAAYNSKNVEISDNVTTRNPKSLYWGKNIKNLKKD